MGIHGLLNQIGHGQRISLAKLSAEYYTANDRPFRLAIDISIWLFQIQSGKGGSNPALRTFYYRLLRLLSLNIHPLFVFDGPNKPLFKRNKKVGGPGVQVASVPEFLAKQLLKQFGFPWHVAPGEAEAECALLQREGIVDAVLSEDVDTLMFGSGVTLRNWTAENSTKSPTHVDLHRAEATKGCSGMDREGMILVALMSGGDYIPEGIPGCGPKLACDAARAGFGKDLCALGRNDRAGLAAWKERLLHEIHTNESKFFSRRNKQFAIPDEFPSREVVGFYTHPCVSTTDKLARLGQELRWDQSIDFDALRSFASDAFDWRCIGGAKKFIKNLAPALLVRELRLQGSGNDAPDIEEQEAKEKQRVSAIHGKRNHSTTDGQLEYRISFIPEKLVPIDLSLEEEDDEFVPAGGPIEEGSDVESEFMALPSSTQGDNESEAPTSPKKRNFKPFDPSKPEKLWMLRPFLQVGCPLLIEEYEASSKDPREFLKQRRNARAAAKGEKNIHAPKPKQKKSKAKGVDMPVNALMAYGKVTKPVAGRPLKELSPEANSRSNSQTTKKDGLDDNDLAPMNAFKMPSTQIPAELMQSKPAHKSSSNAIEVLDLASVIPTPQMSQPCRPFAAYTATARGVSETNVPKDRPAQLQKTPKRTSKKRPSPDLSSPAFSQRTILSYYSPSPRKNNGAISTPGVECGVINLISSPSVPQQGMSPTPKATQRRAQTPTPPNTRFNFIRSSASPPPARPDFSPGKLPDTVTKRRKKSPLKRWQTEPVLSRSSDLGADLLYDATSPEFNPDEDQIGGVRRMSNPVEPIDLIDTSPAKSDGSLVSPSTFVHVRHRSEELEGGFIHDDEDDDENLRPASQHSPPLARSRLENNPSEQLPAYHTPPSNDHDEEEIPAATVLQPSTLGTKHKSQKTKQPRPSTKLSSAHPLRRSPRQEAKKKRIQLRESLEGTWREVEVEAVDMTGDGSGWKVSGGKAKITGWRRSGVEVLDLTGA
jgi:Holliday junction resolvase YEN1